mgnify:CR=1 FL=1
MEISKRNVRTSGGIVYEIANCHKMLNKFDEKSQEYALAFKILVALSRKVSLYAYEGDVLKI